MAEHNYHDQKNIENAVRLREILGELPRFCGDFFRGIEPTTSSLTRIAYAYDLRVFFTFLTETNPAFKNTPIREFKIEVLDQLKALDIEEYLDYLSYYKKEDKEYLNSENGKKRKLIALRTFYNYYFKKEMIVSNPAALVNIPRLHEKEIVRLEIDEVAKMLDAVENGENMTTSQQKYHNKLKNRD